MCKDLEYPLAFTAFIYCFLLIIDSGVVVAILLPVWLKSEARFKNVFVLLVECVDWMMVGR